jgi:hypothetical protein
MVKKQAIWVNKYRGVLTLGAMSAVILIIFAIFSIQQSNSEAVEKVTFKLSSSYGLTIAQTRVASAKYALDGTGEFTEEMCNELGELAKSFDSSADYIKCDSPNFIYLDTPDSSDQQVLTLSDENYTAKFTIDKDLTKLIDYTFSDSPTGGFNKYGGRR